MNTSKKFPGLPDPGIIEQLANEYFKQSTSSLPSSNPVGSEKATILPTPSVPYSAIPAAPLNVAPASGFSHPLAAQDASVPRSLGFSELEGIPASLTEGAAGERGSILSTATPATFAAAPTGLPGTSAFSFLQDIRPLVSSVSPPALDAPNIKIPFTSTVDRLDSNLPGAATPSIPQQSEELSVPQSAGAVRSSRDLQDPLTYQFFKDARPLTAYEGIPKLEPINDVPQVASSLSNVAAAPYDVNAVRRDFPILEERVNGRQIVWLDNAATTQKPQAVIDRLSYYYAHENSNVHRAAHTLAARSTDAYEGARDKVSKFLNASSVKDIIFVRGATEGINLIAQTWGKKNIQKDNEIVITWLEHHANIVPWQMLCAEKGARLRVAPVDNDGQVLLEEYEKLLGPKTKLVSVTQVSNALGTITPVNELVAAAHRYGAKVVVDGAQAISHMPIDVQAIDCDFFVFSGHKVFAPFGIGAVYGKPDVLEHMPPWQGGGNMIVDVTFEKTIYHGAPGRFEAGTGSIGPAVGLGAALDYLNTIGMYNIARYEHELLVYATEALSSIPGLHLIGTAKEKASVLSFVLDGFRTEDVGTALNQEGIAVRSGHHCAQPILRRFGLESTVRPSLALYNTCEEVDKLVAAIWNIKQGRSTSVV